MANIRKVVKIFLASPGGLEAERRAARSLVGLINKTWANYLGYQVELVGWEETLSGKGRPQEQINRDLEQCEFFVGMIWDRWGTPPAASGPYTSGFEEEFRISIDNCNNKGRPKVVLFFKEIDEERLNDIGPQLKKTLAFRERIFEERVILVKEFKEISEFEVLFSNAHCELFAKFENRRERRSTCREPKLDRQAMNQGRKKRLLSPILQRTIPSRQKAQNSYRT